MAADVHRLKQSWADEEPGPFVVYEDALALCMLALLPDDSASRELAKTFAFLDELLSTGDPEFHNLVGAAVPERLADDQNSVERSARRKHRETRRLFHVSRGLRD